jgi:nanoRNase/pAp phosphatase (c-di-AMP/oligoRNAs hydrolase)
MERNGAVSAREQVLDEIHTAQRFCLVTHEHPDGDALGSLVAMHRVLRALGKDSVMLMAADEFPLPYEYRFFDLEGLSTVPPAEITPQVADALYVALVTDTGRFQYENTTPAAHLMAAELIEAGVNTHAIYRRLYEDMPYAKLELLARALAHVERHDGGALTIAHLTRDDFRLAGAEDSYSEGIIDHLRSVEGTKVAALAREIVGEAGSGRKKVSLRSTDGEVDVSAIARAGGGGGHRQAAGFSTELTDTQLVAFLREQVAAQLQPAST